MICPSANSDDFLPSDPAAQPPTGRAISDGAARHFAAGDAVIASPLLPKDAIVAVAAETGLSVRTVEKCVRVARAIRPHERRPGFGWKFFVAVADLKYQVRWATFKEVETGEASVKMVLLRSEMRAARREHERRKAARR